MTVYLASGTCNIRLQQAAKAEVRIYPTPIFKYPRLAYHSENTFVGWHGGEAAGRVVTEFSDNEKAGLNGIVNTFGPSGYGESGVYRFLFPNPTRIEGVLTLLIETRRDEAKGFPPLQVPLGVRYSQDSLTGDDGTWIDLPNVTLKTILKLDYESGASEHPDATTRVYLRTEDRYVTYGQSYSVHEYDVAYSQRAFWDEVDMAMWRTQSESEPDGAIIPVHMRHVTALEIAVPEIEDPADMRFYGWWPNVFLYGMAEPSYYEQGLEIVEADRTDQLRTERAQLGNVPKHSSEDILLRIHNSSPNLTADSITVDMEPPPELVTYENFYQFLFSLDGQSFTESVRIGELSPGATSTTIWVRRVTGAEHPGIEHPSGPSFGQAIVRATTEGWW